MNFIFKYFRYVSTVSVLTLITLTVSLGGCQDRFRYPCQDPANWDSEECKRPACEVNRSCPDLIFKNNDKLVLPAANATPVPKPVTKGDCK